MSSDSEQPPPLPRARKTLNTQLPTSEIHVEQVTGQAEQGVRQAKQDVGQAEYVVEQTG
jgi:hypothetical protein